jgi:hypothetical protein
MNISLTQAREFLAEKFGTDPATVELAGEGAWSRRNARYCQDVYAAFLVTCHLDGGRGKSYAAL